MEKEIIKSYLYASHHLQERASYDLSQTPQLSINSIDKIENKYLVKGVQYINLGPSCTEDNHFEAIMYIDEEEIKIESKIKALNKIINKNLKVEKQFLIEGDPTFHTDTFRISIINGEKYLIQIIDEYSTKIYLVEDNYSLKKGISKNIKNNEITNINNISKRKRKIKNFLKKYSQ